MPACIKKIVCPECGDKYQCGAYHDFTGDKTHNICEKHECQRAEAIRYFMRAFADKPEGPVYVLNFNEKHRELQSRYDVSARALRDIKRRMAAELKVKGVKKPRAKRLTVCPQGVV